MKYTKLYIFLAFFVGAQFPGTAQSNYLSPGNAFVSSSSDNSDHTIITFKRRGDEVHVLFRATDEHGKFVRDLNEDDFSILDDHKPPTSISNFRRETGLPLQLGLLIDTSGSVRTRFDFEQDAAVSFLQQTVR